MQECMPKENGLELLRTLTENLPFPRGTEVDAGWYKYEMEAGVCYARDLYSTPDVSVTHWKMSANSKFPAHAHKELEFVGLYKGVVDVYFGDGELVSISDIGAIVISPGRKHWAFFPVESEYITVMIPASPDYPGRKVI